MLPTTLNEWVALVTQLAVAVLAVTAFLWRAARKPIIDQINGLGERVKLTEESVVKHFTLLGEHAQLIRDSAHDRKDLHDRMGRMEGNVERIVTALERNRDAHLEADGEIRERLVRIETKLDTMNKDHHP